jgi:hypothetical protein
MGFTISPTERGGFEEVRVGILCFEPEGVNEGLGADLIKSVLLPGESDRKFVEKIKGVSVFEEISGVSDTFAWGEGI